MALHTGHAEERDGDYFGPTVNGVARLLAIGAALRPGQEEARGASMRAARLLGYVDARLTALEALREYGERQEYDKTLAALRHALGEDTLAKLMNEGCAWNEDHAVAEAMLI